MKYGTSPDTHCPLPDEVVEEIIEGVRPVCPLRLSLFGSAIELGLEANDIDLLVLSKDFGRIEFDMRRSLLAFPERPFIDTWLYTPDEFDKVYPEECGFKQKLEEESIDLLQFTKGD